MSKRDYNIYQKERNYFKKIYGICKHCSKKALPDSAYCELHRSRVRQYDMIWKRRNYSRIRKGIKLRTTSNKQSDFLI